MHRVGLIVPHGFQLLSLAPLTAFEMTGFGLAKPPPADTAYDLHLLSEHGGSVRSSCGLTVETEAFGDPAFDTIIVGAITAFEMAPSNANLIAFVQKAASVSRRTASFCNGAFVLAEAGLLDGRRATTHWIQAASFKARFPNVRMEEDRIYINDGPIWTSAGMTAGVDLVLAMIDRDLGPEVAKVTAKLMVINQRRMGGQTQHSALLDMTPKSDRIELVVAHIRQNLRNPLTIEELTQITGVGPGKAQKFGKPFIDLIARYVEENDIERAEEVTVRNVVNKSGNKVHIIQNIDKRLPLESIARSKNLTMPDLLTELESIVTSGTKLDITYHLNGML